MHLSPTSMTSFWTPTPQLNSVSAMQEQSRTIVAAFCMAERRIDKHFCTKNRTQAGWLTSPHETGAAEAGKRPDTGILLQFRWRQLHPVRRRLPADVFRLPLLQMVPLDGAAAGCGIRKQSDQRRGNKTVRRVRKTIHSKIQPGEILLRLRLCRTPPSENRK